MEIVGLQYFQAPAIFNQHMEVDMTFTDKTVFNIRLRNPPLAKDIDSRNVWEDDYVFHEPFGTDAEGKEPLEGSIVIKKVARLMRQAALQNLPVREK